MYTVQKYSKQWHALFYFVLLFIMHMFTVLILPAYRPKWIPPFAADV